MAYRTITVPWDYIAPAAPGEGVPNLPTAEGRALGVELARLTDQAAAEHPWLPERCDDCAFRGGTEPNGCLATLGNALKSLMEGAAFYCHHETPDGEEPVCAGWLVAMHAAKEAEAR